MKTTEEINKEIELAYEEGDEEQRHYLIGYKEAKEEVAKEIFKEVEKLQMYENNDDFLLIDIKKLEKLKQKFAKTLLFRNAKAIQRQTGRLS